LMIIQGWMMLTRQRSGRKNVGLSFMTWLLSQQHRVHSISGRRISLNITGIKIITRNKNKH
jgi:hypothetical protein